MPAVAERAAPSKGTAPRVVRAYSVLTTHKVDESADYYTIIGIATAPGTNRVGDSVNPMGGRYKLPIPVLWQHGSREPVGSVVKAAPSPSGIPVEIRIPKVHEAGPVKNRIDEAVQSVRHGLVRGFSVGISANPGDYTINQDGGFDFHAWDWLELSLVTVPANTDATISLIHSISTAESAEPASGHGADDAHKPGASGTSTVVRLHNKQEAIVPAATKTISEQLAAFREARKEKREAMHSIMSAAAEKGETLDAEQSEQYDTLDAEVSEIDKHLKRLEREEARHAAEARSVQGDSDAAAKRPAAGGASHGTQAQKPDIRIRARTKEPGVAFAQYAKVMGVSHLRHRDPERVARDLYPDDSQLAKLVQHDAVSAGSTLSGSWAENLVGDETGVFADFAEFLRPQTIVGRFGTDGIPALRRVPFRTPLLSQTGGGDGYWVGEGKAKPLTAFDFGRATLEPHKVANIAVITRELLTASSPSADMLVRDSLAAALRERLDIDFIDPNKSANPGVSPASILQAPTGIASSGVDAQAVRDDIRALFGAFIAANNAPTSGVWIMPATVALSLSLMQNPLGQAEFPGITMRGGVLFGLPVIVSEYVPTVTAGSVVALVNASDIYLGDEGGVSIDISTEASLEMDNAPTHDSVTPTETTLVSMFQTNSVAFLAERTINWKARRASAAAYLHSVNWGVGVT